MSGDKEIQTGGNAEEAIVACRGTGIVPTIIKVYIAKYKAIKSNIPVQQLSQRCTRALLEENSIFFNQHPQTLSVILSTLSIINDDIAN